MVGCIRSVAPSWSNIRILLRLALNDRKQLSSGLAGSSDIMVRLLGSSVSDGIVGHAQVENTVSSFDECS